MSHSDERFDQPELITTEDGSHSLYLPALKETYHSFHGALQESQHVFIQAGLEYFARQKNESTIRVLEIGFGTGLNALLAAMWASEKQRNVYMDSIEAYPLPPEVVRQLNYPEMVGVPHSGEWFDLMHKSPWGEAVQINGSFQLTKIHEKLELYLFPSSPYHVVFFDAFAPSKQSELWEKEWLLKVCESLATSGVFVTYCAKGQLKRDLKEIGCLVETLPGPPGKKEMVRGVRL